MGRDKALLQWPPNSPGGKTLLSAQIEALKPFTEKILVVAGQNYEALSHVTAAHGASILQNPEPERGQFSSLQIGLRPVVEHSFDAAIITLVDAPPLASQSLSQLQIAFGQAIAQGMWGVAPEHSGKRGHPLFASRNLIDAFLQAPVTSNARAIKHEHARLLVSVQVPDAFLNLDMNTPEQYAALASHQQLKE